MKILVDLNLSPTWVQVLQGRGFEAVHWSAVGDPRAEDSVIMAWARLNRYIILTNDLDFSAILAATGLVGQSVIQTRARDVTPEHLSDIVLRALETYRSQLEAGALITIEESRARARILPFKQ